MKKVLFKLVLTACAMASVAAIAQTSPKSDIVIKTEITKGYVDQRNDLVKKFGIGSVISMGWYTGAVDSLNIKDILSNYIVLSNYLSEKLGRLVVLETDKSDREISKDALGSMDIIYTSAIMGSELMKFGWKPVVGRSEDLQGVILTQESTKIDSPADLKKYKIYGVKGATVTAFIANTLIKNNIYKSEEITQEANNPNFRIINTKQSQLLDLLKSKEIDGAIVRETLANNLIKANPGRYKIAFKADPAPGHILFVSPNVRDDMIIQLRDSFLALNPENSYYKKILSGLDGYQENDKVPFKIVTPENVAVANGVLAAIGEESLSNKK